MRAVELMATELQSGLRSLLLRIHPDRFGQGSDSGRINEEALKTIVPLVRTAVKAVGKKQRIEFQTESIKFYPNPSSTEPVEHKFPQSAENIYTAVHSILGLYTKAGISVDADLIGYLNEKIFASGGQSNFAQIYEDHYNSLPQRHQPSQLMLKQLLNQISHMPSWIRMDTRLNHSQKQAAILMIADSIELIKENLRQFGSDAPLLIISDRTEVHPTHIYLSYDCGSNISAAFQTWKEEFARIQGSL